MRTALITGGSRGLGRAIVHALARRGWSVILDGRDAAVLRASVAALPAGRVRALAGDVTDAVHREALLSTARELGALDLLCNNASALGPSPLRELAVYPPAELARVLESNLLAPLALMQGTLPMLAEAGGTIVNVSSDAAVEAYPGWGGYGASKAALDRVSAVLAAERPAVRVYAFDPGDMRTEMHQRAYPGQDISDRPEPETVVPSLLRLLEERPPSGRYRAADLRPASVFP